jgi:uncharacterized protein with HEPN domain
MQRELAYLLDILQSALLIQEFIHGIDEDAFRRDFLRQDAVIRRIEVIGEATRRISPEYRAAHPEIPWQDMAGMRSKLIHEYDRVDLVEVWNVALRDIPALIALITPLVPPDEPDADE